jgi:hypothetical protein
MKTYSLSGKRTIAAQVRTLRIASLIGLGFSILLFGCTVQQQQQFLDATLGAVIGGKGRDTDEAQPVKASTTAPQPAASAPQQAAAAPPVLSEAEQLLMLWQRTMTEHPQPYLDCLNNTQCGPALKGYLTRLQQQTSRSLELPPAYDRYGLK